MPAAVWAKLVLDAFRKQMHVELPFADIDAAEACEYCEAHGQARPRMRACRPIDCSVY